MTPPRALFLGRSTLDVLYLLEHFPDEDAKVFAREMRAAPGGPALNAAITHALLGGEAVLMTAVGGGPWADAVRGELRRLQIDLIDLAEGTGYETPLTTVLVDADRSTRTCVNPPQSTVVLETLGDWNQAWGEMPRLVLTDGFHLKETLPLLAACHLAGAALCLDGGSWKPGTESLAPLLSIAICSERFVVPGLPADPEATIGWLAKKGVAHVAITRGAKPILGWDRGRRFEIEIEKIEAVDTLGAGDVFHGAFCYHFVQGTGFEDALQRASGIATRSCTGLGIKAWM